MNTRHTKDPAAHASTAQENPVQTPTATDTAKEQKRKPAPPALHRDINRCFPKSWLTLHAKRRTVSAGNSAALLRLIKCAM